MSVPNPKIKLNETAKFATLDFAALKVKHMDAAGGAAHGGRKDKTRLTSASAGKVSEGIKIGGDFKVTKNPEFLQTRLAVYEVIKARRAAEMEGADKAPIDITLPDGKVVAGTAWATTPLEVAMGISKGLAQAVVVARATYAKGSRVPPPFEGEVCVDDGLKEDGDDEEAAQALDSEVWDLQRPLEGSCVLELIKFEDAEGRDEGKAVFWHSSAHVLGSALERLFGSYLTIGPPVANGFYYDAYMGDDAIHEKDFKDIDAAFGAIVKAKQPFERLVVTKAEALELFSYNPFKVQLITAKVPEGARTTVYRNGDLIDLCRGPHLPDTGRIKAFSVLRNSATNWLGDTKNDSLQRVYATSFPDKKQLATFKANLKKAEERDHRKLGRQQKLFTFHELSPGSAFWLPHGTTVYNRLIDFIKAQYWQRGYTEVITPNVYNAKLWETSGHWQHYAENMFQFDCEGQTFALKPMNCPGHCVMFGADLRSYRDLPMRYADFGVLHRNEVSGALTGLIRVRRFQQDDAHIFCRKDQIKDEVRSALDFMKYVYDTFGMTYKLELSTRPKKALGDVSIWNEAEAQLAAAMNDFSGEGTWRVNPGDGAFYGPKIDIKVMDAMGRVHQCATIQLDFQQPIRFDLKYKTAATDKSEDGGFEKPVIIHRAMLGSVERMAAVLLEHYGGKWPFWLSPRQALVVPIKDTVNDYAAEVGRAVHAAGFSVEVELSGATMQKKVREGQLAQFNFILVVGEKERADGTVNVRRRDNAVLGTKTLAEVLAMFGDYAAHHTADADVNAAIAGEDPAPAPAKGGGGKGGGGKKQPQQQGKKGGGGKKQEKAAAEDDDEMDLGFDDDDDEGEEDAPAAGGGGHSRAAAAAALKAKRDAELEAKKQAALARLAKKEANQRSLCNLEIKPWDAETDLLVLYKKIKDTVVMDGLKWSENCALVDVAFGIKKIVCTAVIAMNLSMDAIIEDMAEDTFADEIQSMTMTSMSLL